LRVVKISLYHEKAASRGALATIVWVATDKEGKVKGRVAISEVFEQLVPTIGPGLRPIDSNKAAGR
jgi:hypothetical protein